MMIGKMSLQNKDIFISAVNRSIAHKNEAMTGKKQEEKISAIISPAGKRQNMLQQLMKQKQDLTDRMNSLSASALEEGTNVRDTMEEYRKQLEALDEQILKVQMEYEDKEDSENSGVYKKPKTKEEIEAQRMNDIMSLASNSKQADIVSSTKNRMDGDANVLKAEIKTGYGNIESKMEKVAELESKSANLASEIGRRLMDTNNEVADIQNRAVENENTAESFDVLQNTDIMKESGNEDDSAVTNEGVLLNGDKHDDDK